jgi:hypothetical protein
MTAIPLGTTDSSRSVASVPDINVYNRYFEQDPTNLQNQVALLCRPALRKWLTVGVGPIRAVYSCPGAFSEALFVVSGETLYRIDTDETVTSIGSVTGTSFVSMAATYQYLFIANGTDLQYYDGVSLNTIVVPDGDGIVSVGVIAGYCICVVAPGTDTIKNGRFYWIQPAATIINALDFATAERSPDTVFNVLVVGDQFWLLGPSTTEVWYPSGNGDAPFIRQQGRLFDKGIWAGTGIQIKDSVMAIGTDGTVYRIGAAPEVVSTPGIAQRIREAINLQRKG